MGEEMIGTMMMKMAEENGMKMQPSDMEMEMKMLRRGTYMVIIQTTLTMTKNMGMQVVKMMQNKKMSTTMEMDGRMKGMTVLITMIPSSLKCMGKMEMECINMDKNAMLN